MLLVVLSSSGALQAATLQTAASALVNRGLAVLDEPQLDLDFLEEAKQLSSARLDTLLSDVQAAGADPIAQHYTFAELSHRQKMRWDLRVPDDDNVWSRTCAAAVAAAVPVVEQIHPPDKGAPAVRTLMSGVLISRPGAEQQRWHADCDAQHFELAGADRHCRIYNAFMPLVDIEADADGTQFWPGSHTWPASLPPPTCPPVGAIEAPACRAGGLILADYRCLHRGRANVGRERQIAYVVLGVGEKADDTSNFSPTPVRESMPRTNEQLPFWDEW